MSPLPRPGVQPVGNPRPPSARTVQRTDPAGPHIARSPFALHPGSVWISESFGNAFRLSRPIQLSSRSFLHGGPCRTHCVPRASSPSHTLPERLMWFSYESHVFQGFPKASFDCPAKPCFFPAVAERRAVPHTLCAGGLHPRVTLCLNGLCGSRMNPMSFKVFRKRLSTVPPNPASFPPSLNGGPCRTHCVLVGLSGLEPPTSRLSGVRSDRLSYKPIFSGFEAIRCFFSHNSRTHSVFRRAFAFRFPGPLPRELKPRMSS